MVPTGFSSTVPYALKVTQKALLSFLDFIISDKRWPVDIIKLLNYAISTVLPSSVSDPCDLLRNLFRNTCRNKNGGVQPETLRPKGWTEQIHPAGLQAKYCGDEVLVQYQADNESPERHKNEMELKRYYIQNFT